MSSGELGAGQQGSPAEKWAQAVRLPSLLSPGQGRRAHTGKQQAEREAGEQMAVIFKKKVVGRECCR